MILLLYRLGVVLRLLKTLLRGVGVIIILLLILRATLTLRATLVLRAVLILRDIFVIDGIILIVHSLAP